MTVSHAEIIKELESYVEIIGKAINAEYLPMIDVSPQHQQAMISALALLRRAEAPQKDLSVLSMSVEADREPVWSRNAPGDSLSPATCVAPSSGDSGQSSEALQKKLRQIDSAEILTEVELTTVKYILAGDKSISGGPYSVLRMKLDLMTDFCRSALSAPSVITEKEEQEKDHGAGLIHPVVSPLAETEPRLNISEAWARVSEQAGKGDIEAMLSALGAYFAADALTAEHPIVKGILTDLSETMSHASIDYYASTK